MSQEKSTAIGLDIGTSRIVTAKKVQNEFQFESQLNAFVTIPFSKLTQGVLEKERVPHSLEDGEIIVYGDASEKFANLFHTETRRPMSRGMLNSGEPGGLTLLRQIIAHLAGEAGVRGGRICFSVAGPLLASGENLVEHEPALRQTLQELGYKARSINEGLAVVYGELESSNFTGIGVSCGGGLCNVCLAYLSVPVISFSIPKAGDFIDASAAAVTGEVATRIRVLKEESFHLNGSFTNKVQQALGIYHNEVIRSLVTGMKEAFSNSRNLPKLDGPIPLVISGGTALPEGFRDRFETILRERDFPIRLSEIRLAASPLHSTAKGALIAALADM